ncbi:invasion associated locus B family protein [Pseudoprimorskyibacter insulae]|uniref:Invasion associated locus B (IalB) protein n=1 Tax=Pseudoprimorskyibacter insulae TaxID=1695997 RepID=A0A2R8AUA5_9RHOB|nr:invasion associated locus B family protein [Pseudoprimorskyibacter insulae]SPF79612.1 hypothetical protein PRI8871_01409 [Pseudoprimorskyibacter insulae]
MTSFVLRVAAAGILALGAHGALAQDDSSNRVNNITDWSVFEEENPKECWAVTTYKESVNTKEGRVVAVTRGDILLMVFYRPEAGVNGQLAFTGGYPFASGSTVNVNVDGNEFELFTEGEWAWPATPQDDAKLIASMKRGRSAVVTALSSKGTATKDTFSLLGVTAAIDEAESRCKK